MRKIIGLLVCLAIAGFGAGPFAVEKGMADEGQPAVDVAGPVKMSKKAKTTISGKGFKPGQELNVLFTAKDGVQSDVGYALDPAPKADATGAWKTTWKCGRFVGKKMVKDGQSYQLTITDSDYNPLAHTSVTFKK